MRRDDLMKPDLLSELLLLGSGVVLVGTLLMIVIAVFTPAATVR